MKCSLQNCQGEYQDRRITHVFTRQGKSIVVEGIPARVCDLCGDTVLSWETTEQLFALLEASQKPVRFAPIYAFQKAA